MVGFREIGAQARRMAFCLALTLAGLCSAEESSDRSAPSPKGKTFKINYMSKDFVYLKAGRNDGLGAGDTLAIQRGEKRIALAVVEFASDYSTSCRLTSEKGAVILGDVALFKSKAASVPLQGNRGTDSLVSRVRELPDVHVQGEVERTLAHARGNIAYQMYLEKGFVGDDVRMSRQNARVNLRMSEIPGSHYSMRLDMYSSQRNNLYSGSAGNRDWDNRLNQFSFGYDNPAGKLSYEIGRVIPDKISSIGYIDGGVATLRASESQYLGAFGGYIPRMLYYETPVLTQKYGGFYGLDFDAGSAAKFENTIGFGGEYDGSVISREFINLRNSLQFFGNLSLSQISEIDVNRGWRRQKAGSDFSLSSMYVNGNWRATKNLSFGIQYDTRKDYYRLDTRTLADSLFDDATRMGFKENVYWRFLPSASIYLGLGHTLEDGNGDIPYNYSAGFSVDNLVFKRMYLNTYYTGFESALTSGYNGSAYLRKSFLNGNDFSLGYGRFRYEYKTAQGSAFQSDWTRIGGTVQVVFKTYIAADYEYNWGQAESGHRGYVELGYWL